MSFARILALPALALLVSGAVADPAETWPGLARDLFGGRAIGSSQNVTLEAPVRAEDAAIVPMTLRFAEPDKVVKASLVIDENPMPLAASFVIGEGAGIGFLSTRVRVNSYSNVHAVVETRSGALETAVKFVKASGGCSAPAVKDQDEANANMGKMKYREFRSADPARREAQIMIRHPNHTGMQMDQLTRAYTPAHYIDRVTVKQGDALLFAMEGGISISEDPNFRFSYVANGARTISVEARDTQGMTYRAEWAISEGT